LFNKYIIGAILWAAFILLLTLTPGKSIPDYTLFSYDKLGHACVFLILSVLLSKGLFEITHKKLQALIVTFIGVTIYGLFIEIAQHFIPDRDMEWLDAVANVTGSFLGVFMFYITNKQNA